MSLDNVELYLANNFSTIADMFDWLKSLDENTVLGFDTETTGLDIYSKDAKIRMVQIGDENVGWAIPWHSWSGAALEALDTWEGKFTAHNLAFDYRVMMQLAGYKLPWDRFDDTMIMAQILNPGKPAGLKDLTDKHIDPRASQGEKELKNAFKNNNWTWATVPYDFESYWFYSALDPVLASRLHKHLKVAVDEVPDVYDLEYSVRRVYAELEHTGMRIDLEYVRQKHEELSAKVASNREEGNARWGINIGSTQQLSSKFIELGGQFKYFTSSGAPSVNEDQLKEFKSSDNKEISDLANFVADNKKMAKIDSSYFINFMDMHVDGILHPNIRSMGAITGRSSVTSPALQTLPSGDDLVRSAFIPRRDGDVLASCDYSQVEMRLLAHYSRDDSLISAFRNADANGSDFFTEMGKLVYNDPNMGKDDKRRKLIKTFCYASVYGSGVAKMAKSANVPFEEMETIARDVFKQFPGMKTLMEESEAQGQRTYLETGRAYIELYNGRKIYTEKDSLYRLTNYLLQGTAAQLMKLAVLRLDAAGLTPYMLMCIHDEIIFSIPEDRVDELFPIIQECMSYTDGEFSVDLTAEPEVLGYRWGDGDKYQ